MGLSFGHLVIVLVVVLIMFGAGRLPNVMGDLGRGIRSFKSGLNGEDSAAKDPTVKLPPSDPQA